ncbi:MAG TPA: hypothetical protein VHY48_03200 [Acidobacteriaceae bacterium]|nr:hypothetical protein [Acidobacteriaceae bacterium]
MPAGAPQSWVDRAVQYELAMVQEDDLPLRYRIRRVSEKSDTTRVVIESKQGNVARLVERDGRPLTPQEDAAERSRLNNILQSPDAFLKHEKKEDEGRDYAVQLIKLMPRAMVYTYTPAQPQPAGAVSPQVVIDFHPNPAFKPPTMVSELLAGLEGRVWLDARTGHMTRIEGHVLHTVNFGWGIIAKVYPGGTIEFEQTCVGGRRWTYSHLETNLTLREMMVRTVNDRTRMSAWDFEPLPTPVSFQDAVHALLALPAKPQ